MRKPNTKKNRQSSRNSILRNDFQTMKITFPKPRIVLSLAIVTTCLLFAGCNLTGGLKGLRVVDSTPVQVDLTQSYENVQGTLSVLATQTAQSLPPSPTPIPPSPSPTTVPVTPTYTNTPVTPTVKPPTQAPDVIEKIRFRSGGTSAYSQKSISSDDQHQYRVRALKGQTLILTVSSPGGDVYLGIQGEKGGQLLLGSGTKASTWIGTLPQSQEYLISLTTINPDTYYFLTVEVPANIYFDTGAYSDTVDGYIDVYETFHPDVMTRVRYRAYAFAGQTMTVELSSPDIDSLSLGISGEEDGQVYTNYKVKNNGGEVDLPTTQGYFLDIYAVEGVSTSFTLKVTIK